MPSSYDTLADYAAWLNFRDKAPATVEAYTRTVNEFFSITGADPLKITKEQLYHWDGALSARNLDQNTRARYRAAMRSFLGWLAIEYGVPNLSSELTVIRQRVSDPVVLHPDDLTQILHAQDEKNPVHQRDAAIITLLAATGIRLSECASLNCGAISLRTLGVADKKRTAFTMRVETAKRSGVKVRSISFGNPEDPADVFTRHFGLWFMQKIQMLGSYQTAQNLPLFADGADFHKRLSKATIRQRVRACVKRSGRTDLLPHIHPHSFRHFYATWRMANGGDIFALKRDLGHALIMTTELYVHLAEKATGEQALKFSPLRDVIAKPLEADIPRDQFRQIVKILIPESRD